MTEAEPLTGLILPREKAVDMAPDRSVLYELHCERGYPYRRIAQAYDVGQTTVYRWMQDADVEALKRTRNTPDPPSTRVERVTFTPADGSGYERVHSYHGSSDTTDRVRIHRLLAVAEYGLEALEDRVVHHANGIPWDNRPENLEVLTPEQHRQHHAQERTRTAAGTWEATNG